MKDRLVAGSVAGMAGAAAQNIYSIIAYKLGISDRTFSGFASSVLAYKVYGGYLGQIVGFIAYLAVGLIYGAVFAYIIEITSSKYLYLKGLLYGLALWFVLSGFGTIFDLPAFRGLPPYGAIITLIGGFIYGLVTAYFLKIFDRDTDLL